VHSRGEGATRLSLLWDPARRRLPRVHASTVLIRADEVIEMKRREFIALFVVLVLQAAAHPISAQAHRVRSCRSKRPEHEVVQGAPKVSN
jgi:hypothetical protein